MLLIKPNLLLVKFLAKVYHPAAMKNLENNREEWLAFYDFLLAHWILIRTTNSIE
ncbi:MAG: hypothetical protein ACTS8R_00460 [Arsenophonus sp. NC-QC1-MAG3]